MDSAIATIHRCMQRGTEPLSVIDLIEKNLLDIRQAAWLASMVAGGSSWLVGALPGNAGKTTLMSALLVFTRSGEQVQLVTPGEDWAQLNREVCAVTEEISDHNRSRYIWDGDVRAMANIPGGGGRIAATIHAYTLEQARAQIAAQCAAGEAGLAAFGVFIPIEVIFAEGEVPPPPAGQHKKHHRPVRSRTVHHIHYFSDGDWRKLERDLALTPAQEAMAGFLASCLASGIRSCEALRTAWLERSGDVLPAGIDV